MRSVNMTFITFFLLDLASAWRLFTVPLCVALRVHDLVAQTTTQKRNFFKNKTTFATNFSVEDLDLCHCVWLLWIVWVRPDTVELHFEMRNERKKTEWPVPCLTYRLAILDRLTLDAFVDPPHPTGSVFWPSSFADSVVRFIPQSNDSHFRCE